MSKSSSSIAVDKKANNKYEGSHSFLVNGSRFIVDAKYQPLKPVGHGAYGVVCSALDKLKNKKVALKKIPSAFEDAVDAKRIIREVKLLRHFSHQNCIDLESLVVPLEGMDFEDVYVVMEYMETDLYKIIYSKNELTDDHIQYFMYQLLCGLKYIHSAGVIHRDLKPSNLLVNGNCDLKICDFGLARGTNETDDYDLTEYVVTRWYRAPEIMCACSDYDKKIDVWAAGCIMAELLGRNPIFPGDDYIKQVNLIFDVLGTPVDEDMKFISNQKAYEYIKGLPSRPKIPFKNLYKNANTLALDLLDKMLTFNPAKRLSVDQCLEHPYFTSIRNVEDEVTCKEAFDFSFEKEKMTKFNLRRNMWKEILRQHPEGAAQFARWEKVAKKKQDAVDKAESTK